MSHPEQDELQVLRERAYGPAADIHLDAQALQRLHELEGRGRGWEALPAAEDDEQQREFPSPPADEPALPATGEADVPPDRPRRSPFRVRRSTFLIVLALVALMVVSYAALELVQRVQADPLQAGASQVARLSEDAGYEMPEALANMSTPPDGPQSFEEFYGIRTIINGSGTDTDDKCILVYPSEYVADADGNFMGPAYGGCAAGAFPAAVAFRVDATFPQQLRNAFPDGTALQFVLDESGNEIVVFADRSDTPA